jgi:hypothetical protein
VTYSLKPQRDEGDHVPQPTTYKTRDLFPIQSKTASLPYSNILAMAGVLQTRNLFVAGLNPATDDSHLEASFTPFGKIESSKVMVDLHTAKSRRFGFVLYEQEESAVLAQAAMHGADNGCGGTISVQFSTAHSALHRLVKTNAVYVRNIPHGTTQTDVWAHFASSFGSVLNVELLPDTAPGAKPQYIVAKVTFESCEIAALAEKHTQCAPNVFAKPGMTRVPPLLAKTAEKPGDRARRMLHPPPQMGYAPPPYGAPMVPQLPYHVSGLPVYAPAQQQLYGAPMMMAPPPPQYAQPAPPPPQQPQAPPQGFYGPDGSFYQLVAMPPAQAAAQSQPYAAPPPPPPQYAQPAPPPGYAYSHHAPTAGFAPPAYAAHQAPPPVAPPVPLGAHVLPSPPPSDQFRGPQAVDSASGSWIRSAPQASGGSYLEAQANSSPSGTGRNSPNSETSNGNVHAMAGGSSLPTPCSSRITSPPAAGAGMNPWNAVAPPAPVAIDF